jgi:hypothetical protein
LRRQRFHVAISSEAVWQRSDRVNDGRIRPRRALHLDGAAPFAQRITSTIIRSLGSLVFLPYKAQPGRWRRQIVSIGSRYTPEFGTKQEGKNRGVVYVLLFGSLGMAERVGFEDQLIVVGL